MSLYINGKYMIVAKEVVYHIMLMIKMEQLKKFESIIRQIIGENKYLLYALTCIKERGDKIPSVELSYVAGSCFIQSSNTIKIGVPDILECYGLSKKFNKGLVNIIGFKPLLDKYKCPFDSTLGLSVTISSAEHELVEKQIIESDFLKNEEVAPCDVLAIYSLAYSLYHEIGHALHDKYIPESKQINRERAADAFAFETLKYMQVKEDNDILLLGAFIGIIQIWEKLNFNQELEDNDHPHCIERLNSLLDFWGLGEDSCYWELAYKNVCEWCKKNNLSNKWDNDFSATYNERFKRSYNFFRKESYLKSYSKSIKYNFLSKD